MKKTRKRIGRKRRKKAAVGRTLGGKRRAVIGGKDMRSRK